MLGDAQKATWIDIIGFIAKRKMELAEINSDVYPMTFAGTAATTAQLDAAEQRLGGPLDNQLRELLGYSDGWQGIFLNTHLFDTEKIGQGLVWEWANKSLDILYEDGPDPEETGLPPRDELFPIALNEDSYDVYVIWTGGPLSDEGGHPVIWLAGEEVERYPDVRHFMLYVARSTENYATNATGKQTDHDPRPR